MRSFFIAVGLMILASQANAGFINVSDQQAITSAGQGFNFNFADLPTTGSHGQLSITLNGDYSRYDSESAIVTLDVAGGALDLGNGSSNIISNTIAGLTRNTNSLVKFSHNDRELSWVFDLSAPLLKSIIGDGLIAVSITNDIGVNVIGESNPDFVAVAVSYTVPEPGMLTLFGLGLAGVGLLRRKKA